MWDMQIGALPADGGKVIILGSIARPYPDSAPNFRLLRAKHLLINQNKFRKG